MENINLLLFGPPRLLRGDQSLEPDTRKATAMLAVLALSELPQTRDALAALFYPDYDESHARGALRRTLHALNKVLGENRIQATRQKIELGVEPKIWVDVNEFRSLLESTRSHFHRNLDECQECQENLRRVADLYTDEFMAGFALRDSQPFDDWQFFQRESLRRELGYVLESRARNLRKAGRSKEAIEVGFRWLNLDVLVEEAHRELMRSFADSGQRNAALRQYQVCAQILEQELGVPPLEETTQLYHQILEGFDVSENRAEELNRFQFIQDVENDEDILQPQAAERLAKNDLMEKRTTAPEFQSQEMNLDWEYRAHASNGEQSRTVLSDILEESSNQKEAVIHYPLVGRSRESEILMQAYIRYGKSGYFLALTGDAGIGKTRLAEDFLRMVRSQGAVVIKARCFEGESTLAYSPLVDALNLLMGDQSFQKNLVSLPKQTLTEVGRLLPAISDIFPHLLLPGPLNSPGAQALFFEGLRQLLLHSSRGFLPGVLFLDDLQWADSGTLDFLAYLVRRLEAQCPFILATWRSNDLLQDHPLERLVNEAQRPGQGTQLVLKPLQLKDIGDLVRSISSQAVSLPENVEDRLYEETEGVPFFLVQYLDSFIRSKFEGMEHDASGESWKIPAGVRGLIHQRLNGLDELSRQLMTTASVIGRSFDFDTLLQTSGRSEIETIAGLEKLIAHRLIEECESCEDSKPIYYDFTHQKIRSLVYAEVTQTRRRLLHRRIAEATVAQQRRAENPQVLESKIAAHYQQAAMDFEAGEHYVHAGEYARSLFANREAISHYKSALSCGFTPVGSIHEAIGDLLTLLGEYRSALESYDSSIRETNSAGITRLQHKRGSVYLRKGDRERAIETFQLAHSTLVNNPSPDIEARILVDWSLADYQSGHLEEAQHLALDALGFAEEAGDRTVAARAHNLLGILKRGRGEIKDALEELNLCLRIAEECGEMSLRAAALNNLALAMSDLGEIERSIEYSRQAILISEQLGDQHHAAALHNNLADLLHRVGMEDESFHHLKQAVQLFAEISEQSSELEPEIWKLTEW